MSDNALKFMIIDDEPIAHKIIENHARSLPQLQLIKNCYDPIEAIGFLRDHSVDLIFLDLNMPTLTGFEFLRTLTDRPEIIVTTAYSEFAVEGFELNICDYLLKPFSLERFIQAVHKVSPPKEVVRTAASPAEEASIFLKGDKKHHQVPLRDILFVEACGNYSVVHLVDQKIITPQKISSLESELGRSFIRTHKSYLVAKSKIATITSKEIMVADKKVPIGQSYKPAVLAELLKTD